MNHKWRKGELPQLCERCGILRQRKTFKLLMAITNHPPYNHYLYETKMVYTGIDLPTTTKRPDCKSPIELPNPERSVATKMPKEQNDDNKK